MSRITELFIILAAIVLIAGVSWLIISSAINHREHRQYVRHVVQKRVDAPIRQYTVTHHDATSNNDFLLYYYLFWNNNSTYYYESRTPVNNFSGISFTKVAGGSPNSSSSFNNLPREMQTELNEAKEQDIQLQEANEPVVQEIEVEVVGDTENPETFHDGTDANGDTVETNSSTTESSSPSSDSGSASSSDSGASSGGGDAGGGDSGGGGGGD